MVPSQPKQINYVRPRILNVYMYRVNTYLAETNGVLNEETVSVEPWQEHLLDDLIYSLLLELQGLSTHDWRVDEVESAYCLVLSTIYSIHNDNTKKERKIFT